MWSTSTGDPVGVIMNFVFDDGKFWMTCQLPRATLHVLDDVSHWFIWDRPDETVRALQEFIDT